MRTYMQIEARQLFFLIFMSPITNDSSLIEVRKNKMIVQKINVIGFDSPKSISIHLLQRIWKAINDNDISIKKKN